MNPFKTLDRSEIASWASVAGALALVAGGLLFLFGGEISAWVFLCVVIGVGSIALWMWWAPGEFQAWLAGRQTRFGTTSILISILFVGFVIYVYVLVDRANITVDLTSARRYSLDQQTLDTIEELKTKDRKVQLTGFFSRNKLRQQEAADILLRQYEAEGDGAIKVQYVDPDERPDTAAMFGYQPGLDGMLFLNILDSDGKPELVEAMIETVDADGQPQIVPDPEGRMAFRYDPLFLGSVDERIITTGLKKYVTAGSFKIYFTTGHSERDLERVDEIGISRLAASLVREGIEVASLRLLDVVDTGIPEDASAVLIVGARSPFTVEEVDLIKDYMTRGGRLAIFTDPPLFDEGTALTNTFLREGSPFSDYLRDEFGILVKDELVIETLITEDAIANSEFTPLVDLIASHEILETDRDAQIVLHLARSVERIEDTGGTPQGNQSMYVRQPLLYSSRYSYGKTDLDLLIETDNILFDPAQDTPGPLMMGVTARRSLEFQLEREDQPRLIIIGDSDVIKNEFVLQLPGNVFLWTDIVDWLTGFSQEVTFTPVNDPTLLNLVVSDQERSTIAYITMLVLPGLVLAGGAVVWWYRRR